MASLTTSHVRGATEAVLIEQSLGAYLETAARRWPAREALVVRHQAVRWSYAELNRRAEDFAAGTENVGCADVAAADRADVLVAEQAHQNVSGGDGPEQIRGGGDQKESEEHNE